MFPSSNLTNRICLRARGMPRQHVAETVNILFACTNLLVSIANRREALTHMYIHHRVPCTWGIKGRSTEEGTQ